MAPVKVQVPAGGTEGAEEAEADGLGVAVGSEDADAPLVPLADGDAPLHPISTSTSAAPTSTLASR